MAKKFSLSVSTLRYYDKEGLFPEMERSSGIRRFTQRELDALYVIGCLKKSGLEIKEIRQYMQWCKAGAKTYAQRHQLFVDQKKKVQRDLERMQRVQDMLTFKCWFYEQLMAGEDEQGLTDPASGKMPPEIRRAHENAFSDE